LCDYLLKNMGYRHAELSEAEKLKLMQYDWPGNVRELKNILERAVILQRGSELKPSTLLHSTAATVSTQVAVALPDDRIMTMEEVEKQYIRMALEKLAGNLTKTAKALGISLSTLKRKLKEYEITQ
jgi:DNA-binding NtrC family response regulator